MAEKVPGKVRDKKRAGEFSRLFHIGSIDVIFCCTVIILFAVGIVMMYSASYAYAAAYEESADVFFKKQLILGVAGIVLMFIISRVDYRIFNSPLTPYVIAPGSVILLVLAFVQNRGDPIKRWLRLGPISIQPSEVAKFALILLMAYMLCILTDTLRAEKNQSVIPNRSKLTKPERFLYYFIDGRFKATVLLALVILVFTFFVIIGKHLSGTILIFCTGVAMMWLGGVPKKYFAWLGAFAAIAVAVVVIKPEVLKLFADYAYERIICWLNRPAEGVDLAQGRWQTDQGLIAMGSGGLFGLGLGNSKQKLLWVPEPQNDFIFTIVCEELGFIGALVIILLFAVLIVRGFMIAIKTTDYFGSLVVCGVMAHIGIQVLFNIMVVTDLFPNTGIPLPFFSAGGSSLLILLAEMGVVLSVSRRSYVDKS